IQADQARTIQNAFAGISELPAWRDREGLRVKPVRRVLRAWTERIRSENPVRPLPTGSSQSVIAGDHRREREARLGGEYTRNLPPAGDGSHQRLRPFKERQFVNPAQDKTLPVIGSAPAAITGETVRVLKARISRRADTAGAARNIVDGF